MTAEHPWQSARDEFEQSTLPFLESNGKSIGLKAGEGDVNCQEIMRTYEMLYRSFDPLAFILLKDAVSKYQP